VPETLIVNDSDVYVRSELLAGDPRVHWLVAIVVVSCGLELFTEVINRGVVFGEPEIKQVVSRTGIKELGAVILLERCRILREAMHRTSLPCHTLHQHPDRHPTRERVRVNDHVRLHPTLGKRHINSRPFLRTNTLLAVP